MLLRKRFFLNLFSIMNKKIQITVANISILAEELSGEALVSLKPGNVKSIAAYSKQLDQPVNLQIEDEFGTILHPFLTLENFKQTGGNYEDSFKPFFIPSKTNIHLKLKSKKAMASDFNVQVVFNHEPVEKEQE